MDGQQGREEEGDSSCGAKREAAVLMERANSGAEARERAQGACWVMENPMDRGAWRTMVHWFARSLTRLSD